MKPLHTLLIAPLLISCRTPLADTPLEPMVDVDNGIIKQDDALLDFEQPELAPNCPTKVSLEERWSIPWSPYGIWNRLLSFSPDGQELTLAGGLYEPWNHFVSTADGSQLLKEPTDELDEFITYWGTIIQRDANWRFDVRRIGEDSPILAIWNPEMPYYKLELTQPGELTNRTWHLDALVELSPNGEWLTVLSEHEDGLHLALWHLPTEELVQVKRVDEEIFYYWGSHLGNASLTNEGVLFYGEAEGDTLFRFDLRNDTIEQAQLPETRIVTVKHSAAHNTLSVIGSSGTLHRLSPQTLESTQTTTTSSTNRLNSNLYAPFFEVSPIAMSADNTIWASLGEDGSVQIRNHCSDDILVEIEAPELEDQEDIWPSSLQAYSLSFDLETSQLAVAREGQLSVWEVEVSD